MTFDQAEAMILNGYRAQVLSIIQAEDIREEIDQLFTAG